MIFYHGTPIGGDYKVAARFLANRHALVSFMYQQDMATVAEVCQSFILDNSAFTAWRHGIKLDIEGYMTWIDTWRTHPGFDWALIPDVIDGDEKDNDALISLWENSKLAIHGVPVWHIHESLARLIRLAGYYPIVALGSSGQWPNPGARKWWNRMSEAMRAVCDERGRPMCKLHGLRMMDPDIFKNLPLHSADSTNVAVNQGSISRFGQYLPPKKEVRCEVIASRIESHNSAPIWCGYLQEKLFEN